MDFTNHTYDNVIGKYYAQYRFYDPVNKRFMASDPIKDGDNWYIYVFNNPETFVDPLGQFGILATIGAVAIGGLDAAVQLASGTPINELDWGDIGKSALVDAVGTAAGILTGGALTSVATMGAKTKFWLCALIIVIIAL